jgi:hypothetical protein
MAAYYVGLDVHSRDSVFVIQDEAGAILGRGMVPTTPEGFARLRDEHHVPPGTRVALETGTSAFYVARLLAALHLEPDTPLPGFSAAHSQAEFVPEAPGLSESREPGGGAIGCRQPPWDARSSSGARPRGRAATRGPARGAGRGAGGAGGEELAR